MAKDSKLVYGASGKTNVWLPTKRTRFTMNGSTFLLTKEWF